MAQHGLCALRGSAWAPNLHLQLHPSRRQSPHSENKWHRATHLRTIIGDEASYPGTLYTSTLTSLPPHTHPTSPLCPPLRLSHLWSPSLLLSFRVNPFLLLLSALFSFWLPTLQISAQSQVVRLALVSHLTASAFFVVPVTAILYTYYLLLYPPREHSP